MKLKVISIVIPCCNESGNIEALFEELCVCLQPHDVEFVFVDDGSTDNTLQVIQRLAENDNRIKYLSLSRNFGHQNALKAGIDVALGSCIITMDADLQHPPSVIPEMILQWQQGCSIVFATRDAESKRPFLKRTLSGLYSRIFSYLSDTPIPAITSDFRLIDKKIADILKTDITEYHLFFRGIIPWFGFKQGNVNYSEANRLHGHSKYSYKKMSSLALDGITSFSVKPLRLIISSGVLISVAAFFYALYALYIVFFTERAITGWASVIISVLFIGGLQLIMLGILGLYTGKMFMELKKRPHYIVEEKNF